MKRFAVNFLPESKTNLGDLHDYIAAKSSRGIAAHYVRAIVQEARSLSLAPFRGQSRAGLQRELRTIGFGRSISLLFRIEEGTGNVDIVAVLYRGRLPSEAHRYEDGNESFDEL